MAKSTSCCPEAHIPSAHIRWFQLLCLIPQGSLCFCFYHAERTSPPKTKQHIYLRKSSPFAPASSLYGLGSLPGWRASFDLKVQSNKPEVTQSLAKEKRKIKTEGKENQLLKGKVKLNTGRFITVEHSGTCW